MAVSISGGLRLGLSGGNRATRISFSGSIEEGATTGRAVGTATLANPPEDIGTLTWSELGTGTGAALFAINSSTGGVTNTAAIDYDVATGGATSYTYGIQVTDGVYTYELMATISVTNIAVVPDAPTLTATAGNGQVTLSWTDAALPAEASAITAHKLYRGTASGSLTLIGTITSASPYVDTGLTNGTAYYFKLSAVNAEGESALSTEQSATPAAYVVPAITKAFVEGCSFDDADGEPLAAACTANSLPYYKNAVGGTGFGPGAGTYTPRLSLLSGEGCDFALVGGSGPNDLTGSDAATYLGKQNTYLTALRAELPPGTLICLADPPYADESGGGAAITYNDYIDDIRAANRAAAGIGNIIDVYISRYDHPITGTRAAMANPAYTDDGTHPKGQMNVDATATVSAVVAAIIANAGLAPRTAPTAYTIPAVSNAPVSTMQSSRFVVPDLGPGQTCTVSVVSGGAYIARGSSGVDSSGHATASTSFTVMCGDVVTVSKMSSASNETAVTSVISVGGVERTLTITTQAASGAIAEDTFNRANGDPVQTTIGSKTWEGAAVIASNKLQLGVGTNGHGTFDPGSGELDILWTGVELDTTAGYYNNIILIFGGHKVDTTGNWQTDFDKCFFIDLYTGTIFCRLSGTNYTSQTFTGYTAGTYDVQLIAKVSDGSIVLKVNGSTVTLTNGGFGNMFSGFPSGGNYVGIGDFANLAVNQLNEISVYIAGERP